MEIQNSALEEGGVKDGEHKFKGQMGDNLREGAARLLRGIFFFFFGGG